MHSKAIFSAAVLSSVALAQLDLPIPSEDAQGLESLVQGAIPTEFKSLIPAETKVVDDLAAYVTSITAQPEFASAVAALETAVPLSAVAAIEQDPGAFLMELATGSAPSWFSAIPTGVVNYVESIGEQAVSLLEKDTGISSLPAEIADLVTEVEANPTAALADITSALGGYANGAGGYAYPTGTGAYYPTGTAGYSGYAAPTGANSSVVPYSPSASPEAFTGTAPGRSVAVGAAAMMAGVAALLVL